MIGFHMDDHYQDRVSTSQHHLDCISYQNADMAFLSDRLRAEREAQELTQEELAKLASCGQSTIGNLESGRTRESSKYLPYIAKALGLEVIWLQDGIPPKYRADRDATDSTSRRIDDLKPLTLIGGEAREERRLTAAFSANERLMLDGFRLSIERDKELMLHMARRAIKDFSRRSENHN